MNERRKIFGGKNVDLHSSLIIGDGYDPEEKGNMAVFSPYSCKTVQLFPKFHNRLIYRVRYFEENDNPYVVFSSPDFGVWIFDLEHYTLQNLGKNEDRHRSYTQGVDHITLSGGASGIIGSCGMDKVVKIWNIDGKCLHTFRDHTNVCREIKFLDERTLFSSSYPNVLKVYDLEKLVCVKTVNHGYFWDFGIDPRGLIVAAGYGNPTHPGTKNVQVLDVKNLDKIVSVLRHNHPLYSVTPTSNSQILVGSNCEEDNQIYCWDSRTFRLSEEIKLGEHIATLEGYDKQKKKEGGIKSIVDIPDKNSFATCTKESLVQVWGYEDREDVVCHQSPFGCYGMDYIPPRSDRARLDETIVEKSSERIDIIVEAPLENPILIRSFDWKTNEVGDLKYFIMGKLINSEKLVKFDQNKLILYTKTVPSKKIDEFYDLHDFMKDSHPNIIRVQKELFSGARLGLIALITT